MIFWTPIPKLFTKPMHIPKYWKRHPLQYQNAEKDTLFNTKMREIRLPSSSTKMLDERHPLQYQNSEKDTLFNTKILKKTPSSIPKSWKRHPLQYQNPEKDTLSGLASRHMLYARCPPRAWTIVTKMFRHEILLLWLCFCASGSILLNHNQLVAICWIYVRHRDQGLRERDIQAYNHDNWYICMIFNLYIGWNFDFFFNFCCSFKNI